MESLLFYLVAGAIAGVLGGLLGIGGGMILVPVLVHTLPAQGADPAIVMQTALGTSLTTVSLTAISSTRAHHRRGSVPWRVVRRMTPGIVIGTLFAGSLAAKLPGPLLRQGFGVFLFFVALRSLRPPRPGACQPPPGTWRLVGAGAGIGLISGLTGIGGGSLTMPYLARRGLDLRAAIGAAAACGLPIALAGSLGYILAGRHATGLAPHSSGFVYWPAVAGMGFATLLCAPYGARLAHHLPERAVRLIFAAFCTLIGLRMVIV
ncbi:MAG TPA: sulfite exporter TauE/SafE family protein [Candidatus Acidoferrales bacterium]|nr:sulfite exporter TauE/SafE family protein [Candidatus Acidoferrales bacterium]